jgi:hypothetical protein
MMKIRAFAVVAVVAAAAMLGSSCLLPHGAAGGTYIDPADAATSVVLHVENLSSSSIELRAIQNGQSLFVGSVAAADSTSILLDPSLFPTATLYVAGIPAGGSGRAMAGPLAASKGSTINFTIESRLRDSHAIVLR